MLSVLVDNSVLKTRAERPSDKEGIEMYSFLDKSERENKDSDIEPLYEGPKFLKRGKSVRYGLTALCLAVVILCVLASVAVLCYKLATLKKQSETDATPDQDNGLPPFTAQTTCGYVKGDMEEDVFVFKGIPYAVPPTGKYRWKAPVPLEEKSGCWIDTYEATDFKTKCFQKNLYTGELLGSEDCLYLNVWTPSLDATEALNVMVFIHGGGTETDKGHLYGSGLMSGSGQEGGMMPDAELAKTANMVFVSFNYRLGPFGFLAVNVTDPVSGDTVTGNYGFMDQALVLKWIKDNIANFGGDPTKVTVFGLGGGATSIFALLSSEQSMGLFQKAWLASPSPSFDTSLEQAFVQNQNFVRASGCRDSSEEKIYSCIEALDPEQVLTALPLEDWANIHFRDLPTNEEQSKALAIVDGKFMKASIHSTWHSKQGPFKNISLLIGSSAQEVDDWLFEEQLSQWQWSMYEAYIHQRFADLPYLSQDLIPKVLKLYPHEHTPEYQLTSMISDIRQVCGVNFMAHLMAEKWLAPVYRYIANFTVVSPDKTLLLDPDGDVADRPMDEGDNDRRHSVLTPGFRYAYHGIDVRHFFAEHEEDLASVREAAFAGAVRRVVFEFVREGHITDWDTYPSATGLLDVPDSSHMTLSQVTKVPYHNQSCECWKENYFFPQHAWMNKK